MKIYNTANELSIGYLNGFLIAFFLFIMQASLYTYCTKKLTLFIIPLGILIYICYGLFIRKQNINKLPEDFLTIINLTDNIWFCFKDKRYNFKCSYNYIDSSEIIFWCYSGAGAVPIIRSITIKLVINGKEYELESNICGRMSRVHKIFKYLKYIKNFKYKFHGIHSKEIRLQYKDIFETYLKTECPFEIISTNEIKKYIQYDIIFLIIAFIFTFVLSYSATDNPFAWLKSFVDGSWPLFIIGFISAILFIIFLARIILNIYLVNKYKIYA